MGNIAIRVEGLGKMYRIGGKQERYRTLRDTLTDAFVAPFRRASSLLRGQAYGAAELNETIWALKDVSFEVKHGEVVGIIGRNGAGKSTLLKILSRITEPTEGYADVYGRVGSLLEVGTGFHPELTGRENIYLNGAILGMSRAEIDRKFDEIVAFAEIEKFIDTPVKHYSSGMGLRLGFAVAAHLEPEILVVDEVLAVGDAQFQKKCLGKMSEVAGEGRTVLFVSHNMAAVQSLCKSTYLLHEGILVAEGDTDEIIKRYLRGGQVGSVPEQVWGDSDIAPGDERIRIVALRAYSDDARISPFAINKPIHLEVEYYNLLVGTQVFVVFRLSDAAGTCVFEAYNSPAASYTVDPFFCAPLPIGRFRSRCSIPANFLNEQQYTVTAMIVSAPPAKVLAEAKDGVSFAVFDTGDLRTPGLSGRWLGSIRTRFHWQTQIVDQG